MSGPQHQAVAAALAELGPIGEADAPLGARTTYRVGGRAAVGANVSDLAGAARVARAVAASGLPVLVVGRGSNLHVADAGFPGIAVIVGAGATGDGPFADLTFDPGPGTDDGPVDGPSRGVVVTAGAAVPLPTLARRCARAGVRGLEWTVGVPGSVGGAVRMNAGGHGSDMAASLLDVTVVELGRAPAGEEPVAARRDLADLDYRYRHSSVAATDLVVSARFAARRGSAGEADEEISGIVRWRREHQPGGQNAGSVFTNPDGDSAGRLIEALGLKGHRIGTAEVSPKHANFIQADPDGRADDVRALIEDVRRRVADAAGVHLRTEIRLIGFSGGSVGQPSPSSRGTD